MSSTIDPKDAAVLKLAALACLQLAGRSKRELDEFAAETQTEMQPPEEAMERINRLMVGLTRPLATSCTKNHYDIEYTGAKDEAHLVCAALIVRLFELLGMPLDEDEQRWDGGQPLSLEERKQVREFAASIHIEPAVPTARTAAQKPGRRRRTHAEASPAASPPTTHQTLVASEPSGVSAR